MKTAITTSPAAREQLGQPDHFIAIYKWKKKEN